MELIKNIKIWLTKIGLTNLIYLLLFIASLFFGNPFISGAMLGIFIYINFNVIQKIIIDKIKK